MKTKAISALLAVASSCTSAMFAQTVAGEARTVPDAPTAAAAPIASVAPTIAAPTETTAPNQIVYTARLPAVQELTDAAAAHGTGISRIEQTSSQVIVTYQLSNGRSNVVAYQLLPNAGSNSSARVLTTPAPAVVTAPAPTVVYTPRQRVVYYDTYPTYDPWYWYPPVSLSFGFGFGGGYYGHYHGGYRGGFHHGHR